MPRVIEIKHSPDFDRIASLPRRRITDDDAAAWAQVFTEDLLLPGRVGELKPGQGISLAEVSKNLEFPGIGAWLGLPVGIGKTHLTALIPAVVEAKKPLLILPANLIAKTWRSFEKISRDWRMSNVPVEIKSWHWLTTDAASDYLDRFAPDCLMIDESDELSNPANAATARIDRRVIKDPSLRVYAMTGTPGRTSILNYWHIMCWCLRERAPVPMRHTDAKLLAQAIDYKVREPSSRPRPGPWGATRDHAREWYSTRLAETQGVVLLDGDSCDQPLTVRFRIARESSELDEAYKRFLKDFETPGGEVVTDPLSRWRLDGHLGCGLYSRYIKPPPLEVVEARRALGAFVRERIQRSARGSKPLDTEGQVLRKYADHPIVQRWVALKDSYDKRTETIWFSQSTILSAADWLRESDDPGIIWCGSVEYGIALAQHLGLEYYGREGRSLRGVEIIDAPEGVSFVASWNANKKGFDLQPWRRNLIVMPPQSARWLEQLFGRPHRQGQDRPVVFDVLITSGGTIDAFESAVGEAEFNRDTVLLTQKILRAEIVRRRPIVTPSNKYRWATRTKEK